MAKPDFMYNQAVTWDAGTNLWTYSPLRYWPNEFGQNAESEEIDRLTFFAYAPWVRVTPATGILTSDYDNSTPEKSTATGIIGMSRNTSSGAPLIKYASSMDATKCVDLCWGVAAEDFTSSVDGTNNTVAKGKPYLDVIKPGVNDKIFFDFKHALAALNVQIDADVDDDDHNHPNEVDEFTRIYVRSITFEGFTTTGALDLNSDYTVSVTPNWFDLTGNNKLSLEPITIYDGRRDGKEGVETAVAKNESPADLNPVIVQANPYTTTLDGDNYQFASLTSVTAGVTKTAVNLFKSVAAGDPIYVIPTEENVKVTIVYDVETADNTLPGYLSDGKTHGTSVQNAITNSITLASGGDMKLDSGKKYIIKLHLGMTSVKFDAKVTGWDAGDEGYTDLPYNNGTLAAGGTVNAGSTVNWSEDIPMTSQSTTLSFTIAGLKVGSTITSFVFDPTDVNYGTPGVSYADGGATVGADGKATITFKLRNNGTGADRDITMTANGTAPDDSSVATVIKFTQAGS